MSTRKSHGRINKPRAEKPEEHQITMISVIGQIGEGHRIYSKDAAAALVKNGELECAWYSPTECWCGGELMKEIIEADGTFQLRKDGDRYLLEVRQKH